MRLSYARWRRCTRPVSARRSTLAAAEPPRWVCQHFAAPRQGKIVGLRRSCSPRALPCRRHGSRHKRRRCRPGWRCFHSVSVWLHARDSEPPQYRNCNHQVANRGKWRRLTVSGNQVLATSCDPVRYDGRDSKSNRSVSAVANQLSYHTESVGVVPPERTLSPPNDLSLTLGHNALSCVALSSPVPRSGLLWPLSLKPITPAAPGMTVIVPPPFVEDSAELILEQNIRDMNDQEDRSGPRAFSVQHCSHRLFFFGTVTPSRKQDLRLSGLPARPCVLRPKPNQWPSGARGNRTSVLILNPRARKPIYAI